MGRAGTYMWTASSAGWAVLAYLTGVEAAAMVSGGCAAAAVIWYLFIQEYYDD